MRCTHIDCKVKIKSLYNGLRVCKECYWFVAFFNGGFRGKELFERIQKVMGEKK